MSLWVDKHRPTLLSLLDFNEKVTNQLTNLVIFYLKSLNLMISPICLFMAHLVQERKPEFQQF
jgi:hypothetical protein